MTRTLLVAGVGKTIGAAVARRFAEDGWNVALLARSSDVTDPLAEALRERGSDALALRGDVTDREAVEAAVSRASDELGPVECVVCNATAGGGHPFEDADADTFRRIFEVRTLGSFHLVRAAAADLRETGGTVLFSGTTYATRPAPEQVEWSAGAPATRGLARTLDASRPFDVCYVRIGSAVRPPESEFSGAIGADEVAERYLELATAADPPWETLLE